MGTSILSFINITDLCYFFFTKDQMPNLRIPMTRIPENHGDLIILREKNENNFVPNAAT